MEQHAPPLIATIVLGIGLAFVFGTIANRLRVSPLVGYLLAGVAVGPSTPGFVADQNLALQLAEIGVILLMFGVGLHFSIKDLLSIRAVVIPGALLQVAASSLFGFGLAVLAGWPGGTALVFGIALSVASTVVLTRALQERRLMDTERGHLAVGWLIVQDLLMILVLVMLPAVAAVIGQDAGNAGSRLDIGELAGSVALTIAKVAGFIGFMLVVGRRAIPLLLHYVAHTGSRELFRLAVLSVALGVAFAASQLFDVSFALGAFVAGMTLERIGAEPGGGRGVAAAARRVRGAVLRLGRHAVRPDDPGRRSAADRRRADPRARHHAGHRLSSRCAGSAALWTRRCWSRSRWPRSASSRSSWRISGSGSAS